MSSEWTRSIVNLKHTNNKMVVLVHTSGKCVYFSRNEYKTLGKAIKASNKYMKRLNPVADPAALFD